MVTNLFTFAKTVGAMPEHVPPPGVDLDLVLAGPLVAQQGSVLIFNPIITSLCLFVIFSHANPGISIEKLTIKEPVIRDEFIVRVNEKNREYYYGCTFPTQQQLKNNTSNW